MPQQQDSAGCKNQKAYRFYRSSPIYHHQITLTTFGTILSLMAATITRRFASERRLRRSPRKTRLRFSRILALMTSHHLLQGSLHHYAHRLHSQVISLTQSLEGLQGRFSIFYLLTSIEHASMRHSFDLLLLRLLYKAGLPSGILIATLGSSLCKSLAERSPSCLSLKEMAH